MVARAYRAHTISGGYKTCCTRTPGTVARGRTELTEVPRTGMNVKQNSQIFRVRVRKSHITSRRSGYCGTGVQNLQNFRAGEKMLYSYPGYCGTGVQIYLDLTEVPGTGMNVVDSSQKKFLVQGGMDVVQNSQKIQVRVIPG